MERTLNLGILAHVDAGKTSLTERLLYAAGITDQVGRVDDGNTRTDSLALERQRGITIKSAVVSFPLNGVTVNLIDTPGHPDFIAEVERVLAVLDGVVLVVSAVEGVQAQTRILARTLQRLRIPTLYLVNKVDRPGADPAGAARQIADKLTPAALPMGRVYAAGSRAAAYEPYGPDDQTFASGLLDLASAHDEAITSAYVEDGAVPYRRLRGALASQTRAATAHPVFFGSAVTGAGIEELITGITELLPAAEPDPSGPASGSVFKVERSPGGGRTAYVRLARGTLRARERVAFGPYNERGDHEGQDEHERHGGKVTGLELFDAGGTVTAHEVPAGRIGKVRGLEDVRIGDSVGGTTAGPAVEASFAPPTLETVVVPQHHSERGALHFALAQLADADPLIGLRRDGHELSVSLYGEVQKEVIQATLEHEHGVRAIFQQSSTIHLERPVGVGSAVEFIAAARGGSTHQRILPDILSSPHPFLATVGLRVQLGPVDSGIRFGLDVEPGSMPPAFFRAVEESARRTLAQGLLGWRVTDCLVTMTHSGYAPRMSQPGVQFDRRVSSTANDFRNLTPLVLMAALREAGTRVYEPVHQVRMEIPPESVATVAAELPRLGGVAAGQEPLGSSTVLHGQLPAGSVYRLQQLLPSWTSGEGAVESFFDHHRPVRGAAPYLPSRPRTDHNPLDRAHYLSLVGRRTQAEEETL